MESVSSGGAAPSPPRHVFCCRRCRAALFTDLELVRHSNSRNARGNKGFRRNGGGARDHAEQEASDEDTALGETCTSYFLDPDITPWVAAESRAVATGDGGEEVLPDTIYCRNEKCRVKIGTQSWTGAQCSCGAWITPAFKILAKAVDKLPADLVQQ